MIDIENIEKKENYNIPDGYFDEFPGKIMQKIEKERLKRKTRIVSGVAAAALFVIASTFFITFNSKDNSRIIAEQPAAMTPSEEEALESLATEYYSEELALMDFYTYEY